MATLEEARRTYMKLLKIAEQLSSEERTLAAESFTEGWIQCELQMKEQFNALPR